MAPLLIRAAKPGDIPAIRALLRAHDNDTEIAPGGNDIVGPYVRHLVDHHVALVADDAGAIAGYGAAVDTGRGRFLSDLFVAPDRLGTGIGGRLLAAVFGETVVRATLASDDPRALPLYVRAGMTPLWPNLYLRGDPRALPPLDAGLTARDSDAAETAALERTWTGADRPVDHGYWAAQAEADAFVVEDRQGPAAIGWGRGRQVGRERVLDRLLIRPDVDAIGPAIAAHRRAGRGRNDVASCVLGPNPLLRVLLDARFRIVDHDQFLASDPSLVDPARLLPNPGML